MLKYILVITACFLVTRNSDAQNHQFGFGFRAGPSYSKIEGPSETGPGGEALETFPNTNGFHIGPLLTYRMTDLWGFRTEFVFSQRGTKYTYDGPSYYVLGRYSEQTITINGTRHQNLKVSNAFVDMPLMAYYKIGSLELAGGFNTGILIASTAGGTTNFEGISPLGAAVTPFEVGLDYNYKTDDASEAVEEFQDVVVDGKHYAVPTTVGAYYEFETKDKNFYETFDFGLVGAASFYLNEGLFLSARYVFGLGDVDDNTYDASLQDLYTDGSTIPRADTNKSKSLQFSIGFSF